MARPFRCFLCSALVWLAGALQAPGQENGQRRNYEIIPFSGDQEKALRERLFLGQKLDNILHGLDQLGLDPMQLKQLQKSFEARDPSALAKLKQIAADIENKGKAGLARFLLENVKEAKELLKDRIAEKRKALGGKQPAVPPPPTSGLQDRAGEWTRNFLKKIENSRVGDAVQSSPAWKQALADIQESAGKTAPAEWNLGPLGKIKFPDLLNSSLVDKAWTQVRSLKMPSLPSINISVPRLAAGTPQVALPAQWPAAIGFLVAFVTGGLALWFLWQLYQRKRDGRTAIPAWRLGPWPVHPGRIGNAGELKAAFEYLAFLRLGQQARSWNHRAVERHLAGDAGTPARQAAHELAGLYERARYCPGQTSLPEKALVAARRDLCLLGGVAMP